MPGAESAGALALQAPSPTTLRVLFALAVVLPIVLTAVAEISKPAPSVQPVLVIAGFVLLLYAAMALALRRRSLRIAGGRLEVRSTFYTLKLPLAEIDREHVDVIDPIEARKLIGWRSNGIGTPGYQSGWFLRRGGGKLFVVRRTDSACLCIPTRRRGLTILLGSDDGEAAKARLLAAA